MPRNLIVLNCSENNLTQLPQLPQTLKILYCFGNPLSGPPKWFPDSLTMLDISGCDLEELPDRLPKSLNNLKCNNNKLYKLPEKLPSELNSLNCSYNQITELPQLPIKLLVINAKANKLTIFDFTNVRANMSICIDDNLDLPQYREPVTHQCNIKFNIELTNKTIWSRRMLIMRDELISTAYRVCYSPARIERLISSGDFNITELGSDL
jgi:Leucine-rich repeat (LRR) protein